MNIVYFTVLCSYFKLKFLKLLIFKFLGDLRVHVYFTVLLVYSVGIHFAAVMLETSPLWDD